MKALLAIAGVPLLCAALAWRAAAAEVPRTPTNQVAIVISELNAVANSPSAPIGDRTEAIFTLFADNIRPGMTGPEIRRALANTRWLDASCFHSIPVFMNYLNARVPIATDAGGSCFWLELFADNMRGSGWSIFFRLSEPGLKSADATSFLEGRALASNPKLVEFVLYYPPGAANHPERLRIFGPAGQSPPPPP